MSVVIIANVVLVLVLILGVPIPLAFFAATLSIVIFGGYDHTFLLPYGYNKISSIILVAIPLFILAGSLMEKGGIGKSLVDFVEMFIGKIKGGLGVVMVVSCGLFGAISGSGMATLSCIGSIMLPRMYEAGYPKGISSAVISSGALLSLLIPPSLNQILYAFVGSQSVLASFMATLLPGIIMIILLSLTNLWLLRNDTNIQIAEPMPKKEFAVTLGKRTGKAIPALIAPLIILGGIYGGFMTPTEAAAVSIIYAIPVGLLIYKELRGKAFKDSLVSAGTTAGVVMIMLFSVMVLSRLYVMENVPQMILNAMFSVSENRAVLILMVNLFLIAVGMLMDDTSAILLTTPIILPVVIALGIHPIHYAAIMGVNIGMGCAMPPVAPFLYLGARVGDASIDEMLKPTFWIIMFAWLPTLLLTTYVPSLSLFIPRALGLII